MDSEIGLGEGSVRWNYWEAWMYPSFDPGTSRIDFRFEAYYDTWAGRNPDRIGSAILALWNGEKNALVVIDARSGTMAANSVYRLTMRTFRLFDGGIPHQPPASPQRPQTPPSQQRPQTPPAPSGPQRALVDRGRALEGLIRGGAYRYRR